MSQTFAEFGLPTRLVDALAGRGIINPFEVQRATIADALAGRDVCGRAPTGSGKTLAFGVPLIARVERGFSRRPRALVLAPTRELAEQIATELAPLASAVARRVTAVYGGVGYGPQRQRLRKGVDILVACPGRLKDLIDQGDVELCDVDIVVVDEADRMADMGFLPDVRRLLDQTAKPRQTVLFSATLDGDVAVLTRDYQSNPVRHEVGPAEPDIKAATHLFWKVSRQDRIGHTAAIIVERGQTIVFCRTRHGADRLARQLGQAGVSSEAIHGGRSQGQRDRALRAFSAGRVSALVATDVAARGIHVDGVACVVHFDPPEDHKAYLHRSGRTARAGATGTVLSLLAHEQVRAARQMQNALKIEAAIESPGPAGPVGSRPAASASRPDRVRDGNARPKRPRRPAGSGGAQPGAPGRPKARKAPKRGAKRPRPAR
ncbi:MAG: DEAD/DEAH box helicase [Acidimicrobiales bacterium]